MAKRKPAGLAVLLGNRDAVEPDEPKAKSGPSDRARAFAKDLKAAMASSDEDHLARVVDNLLATKE